MPDLQPIIFPPNTPTVVVFTQEQGSLIVLIPQEQPILETPVEAVTVVEPVNDTQPIIVEAVTPNLIVIEQPITTAVITAGPPVIVIADATGAQGPRGDSGNVERYLVGSWDGPMPFSTPSDPEFLFAADIPTAMRIRADAPKSFAKAKTPATSNVVLDVTLNEVVVGTLTFGPGDEDGVFVITDQVDMVAGDLLEIPAPTSGDATLADIRITITTELT